MDLINLIIILIIVGVILYFINTFITMDGKVKQILNFVVILVLCLWLLNLFLGPIPNIQIGRLR